MLAFMTNTTFGYHSTGHNAPLRILRHRPSVEREAVLACAEKRRAMFESHDHASSTLPDPIAPLQDDDNDPDDLGVVPRPAKRAKWWLTVTA